MKRKKDHERESRKTTFCRKIKIGHLKKKTMNQGSTGMEDGRDDTECRGNREWGLIEDETFTVSSKNFRNHL
jgi:hypothetical protein